MAEYFMAKVMLLTSSKSKNIRRASSCAGILKTRFVDDRPMYFVVYDVVMTSGVCC